MGIRMKLSNIKNSIQTKLHGKVKKTMINERKELKLKTNSDISRAILEKSPEMTMIH